LSASFRDSSRNNVGHDIPGLYQGKEELTDLPYTGYWIKISFA
jgi:hypothetical protein